MAIEERFGVIIVIWERKKRCLLQIAGLQERVRFNFKMVPEHNVLNVLTYATIGSCHNGNLSTQVLSI